MVEMASFMLLDMFYVTYDILPQGKTIKGS